MIDKIAQRNQCLHGKARRRLVRQRGTVGGIKHPPGDGDPQAVLKLDNYARLRQPNGPKDLDLLIEERVMAVVDARRGQLMSSVLTL